MVRLACTIVMVALASGCVSFHGAVHSSTFTSAPYGSLRHAVMFKFKNGVTPAQVRAVENALQRLPQQIADVHGFEWGTEVSGRELNKGFTHMALFTFDDRAALERYRNHSAHQDFLTLAMPFVEEIFVFDYWAAD
jgi:hypothetical protein